MKSEANISNQKFHALNGVNDIPRSEIESIVDLAKQENNAEVIYRLSKVLRANPDAKTFSMTIAKYPTTGLNGAQHTGDYKEALDDCGRLRPGYRFMGGKVVKVLTKKEKAAAAKEIAAKIEKGKSPIDAVIEVGEKVGKKPTAKVNKTAKKAVKVGEKVVFVAKSKQAGKIRTKKAVIQIDNKNKSPFKKTGTNIIADFLEKNENPKPFSNKPKSTSVATAVNDVLSLSKYKGAVKPLVANLLYKLFKNDLDAEINPDSDFDKALLKKDSPLHFSFDGEDILLTSLGIDFVKAVSGRLESLRNQKHNYAMFDGLAGAKKVEFDEKNVQRLIAINLQVDLAQNKLWECIKRQGYSSMVNVPEKIRNTNEFKKLNKEFQKENEASKQKAKYLGASNKTSHLQRQADLKEYKNRLSKEIKKQKPLKGIVQSLATNLLANSLMAPEPTNSNPNSLASRISQRANTKHEYYTVANKEISNFLGNIEKKNKESVAITIAGGQGSMKTRLCFQLMNAFGQNYKVGHASIEEHPESALYFDKAKQYCNTKALHNISAPEINSIEDVHKLVRENDVIVIDSFSKLQEMDKNCQLDKDFRKAYDGKLFIIIYQLTSDGKMRGGAKSQFDGDCIAFIEKKPNYTENYVWWDKNRYQDTPELKYNIYSGKIQKEPEPQAPKQKDKPKTETFSFEIV